MALTLYQKPPLLHGCFNELFHTCTSDEVNDPAFRYKFVLALAAFNFNDVILNPYNTLGVFNAKKLLSSQLTTLGTDYDPDIVTWTEKARSILNYELTAYEYGAGTDSEKYDIAYAINSVNPTSQDANYLYKSKKFYDYIAWDSKGRYFLQTWEGNRKARRTDIGTLSLLNGKFSNTYNAKIKYLRIQINSDDGQVRKYYIENPDYLYDPAGSLTSNAKKMRLDVPAYPVNWDAASKYLYYNSDTGGAVSPAVLVTTAIFQDNDISYTIWAEGDVADSCIYTSVFFELIDTDACDRYAGCQIAFRNSLGSYEYYPFTLVTMNSIKVDKNTYEKNKFSISGTSVTQLPEARGIDINNIEVTERITVNSDFYDETTSLNLKELFTSNDVYIIQNAVSTPVILDMDEYAIVSKEWAKMGRITLDLIKSVSQNNPL